MKKIFHLNAAIKMVLLCMLILKAQSGYSQSGSQPKITVSYTQSSSNFFEIDKGDVSQLLEFEKVGMKNTTEVRNVNLSVDQNNDLTTIISIMSSNANETWMNPPAKIIIDKSGVKMFNAQNAIISQDIYTPEQQASYNATKVDISQNGWRPLPIFTPLSQTDVQNLQQQGFTVQTLPGGIQKLKKGQIEISYDNTGMTYDIVNFSGQKIVSQTTLKFQQVGGKTLPLTKTERKYETSSAGVCYATVSHTVFSNYQSSGLP
jgi:hypothetical protein